MDPFVQALRDIWAAPGMTVDAVYRDVTGWERPLRVAFEAEQGLILDRLASADAPATVTFLREDLEVAPRVGAAIDYTTADGAKVRRILQGVPTLDEHRLLWRCDARVERVEAD